jgi:hypothetical protein
MPLRVLPLEQLVKPEIEQLFATEGFPDHAGLVRGVLKLVDALQSYHEEGRQYFPEVLLTTSLRDVRSVLSGERFVPLMTTPFDAEGAALYGALKQAAPLARGGWVVACEIANNVISSGLLFGDATELSPGVYRQTVGDLGKGGLVPSIYLRGLGNRRVEVAGRSDAFVVALCLDGGLGYLDVIKPFVASITAGIDEDDLPIVQDGLARLLDEGLRETHGTLAGVVEDTPEALAKLQDTWKDGLHLVEPIDIALGIKDALLLRTNESSTAFRSIRVLVKGMLASDGITVFSTKGRIVAFKLFLPTDASVPASSGGARSRAFTRASASGLLKAVLALSHDGNARCEVLA